MSITSGIVRVRLNIPEVSLKRKVWSYSRNGAAIAADRLKGAPASAHMLLLPGGAWSLMPFRSGWAGRLGNAYTEAEILEDKLNLAPGVLSESLFHKSDLPGLGFSDDTLSTALRSHRKTVTSGLDWDAQIETASAAAVPSPRIDSPTGVPMDRLLAGKESYAPNTGYGLMFGGLGEVVGKGPFCTLLFGGNTPVRRPFGVPASTGGQFALNLNQDGSATLYERDELNGAEDPQDYWERRGSFQWGDPNTIETRFAGLFVIPYGRDRIALLVPATINTSRPMSLFGVPFSIGVKELTANRGMAPGVYTEQVTDTGHWHQETMTGAGPIYLDNRRDMRGGYSISRVMYPETGVLVDAPFEVDGPTGPGYAMRVSLDTFILPEGGSLAVTVYDATTHLPLAQDLAGRFITLAGQKVYYLKFTFTASEDRFHSPILSGWSAVIDGQFQIRNPTPTVGGKIRSVGIQGPSRDCTTESAGVEFKDPYNQLGGLLQYHDGFRSDIVVVNPDNGAVLSRLFEGVVAEPEFDYRSNAQTRQDDWYDYPHLRMVGMASRLGEQVPLGKTLEFGKDAAATAASTTGEIIPWKVADVLRLLLNDCGVPDDEIDIPAYYRTIRLWGSTAKNFELHQLHPGGHQSYLRFIQKLCQDYLGAAFVRDPNAGSRGMWRLLPNATVNSPVRAVFLKERPGGAGIIGTRAGAYGAGQTWWQDGTFREYIRRPEINYLKVVGGAGSQRLWREFYNWTSHEFFSGQPIAANPSHPDYLGRMVPYYLIDPTLTTQQAVDFVGARLFQRAGHAEKTVQFRAPLMLITALDDPYQTLPRPLRIQDLISVQGPSGAFHPAVVKSCNPAWRGSDGVRMANYEAFYLPS